MSKRPTRILRKRFIIYCEGDTEYNYIEHMRKNQGVELALRPVNMHGGGYTSFLNIIKSEASNNCLAKFIIVDGDRARDNESELRNLESLLDYCIRENRKGKIPHILILDCPDFEYVACLHDPEYSGQNTETYISNVFGFKTLERFKSSPEVYHFLNSSGRSYQEAVKRTKTEKKALENRYHIIRSTYDIGVSDTRFQKERIWMKGSNIHEFFEIIDW